MYSFPIGRRGFLKGARGRAGGRGDGRSVR